MKKEFDIREFDMILIQKVKDEQFGKKVSYTEEEIEYLNDLCDKGVIIGSKELLDRFFWKRFHKLPENDPAYYEEWRQRFRSGDPTRHMDSKSIEIYKELWKRMI